MNLGVVYIIALVIAAGSIFYFTHKIVDLISAIEALSNSFALILKEMGLPVKSSNDNKSVVDHSQDIEPGVTHITDDYDFEIGERINRGE